MKKLTLLPLLSFLSLLSLVSVRAADLEKANFAAGCFWCMEALYEGLPGVTEVVSGYSGGKTANPTYEEVCKETTGHAEAIEVTFDPNKVTYEQLLQVFWKSHDPANGKGVAPDFGSSYRPVLFYRNDAQKASIEKIKAAVEKDTKMPVATEIVPFVKFWPAEGYHQNYVKNHPDNSYVKNVSVPRVKATLGSLK